MSEFEWDEKRSVRIPSLDAEHQHIARLMKKFGDACEARVGDAELADIFEDLVAYSHMHHRAEERHFRQQGFPEADAHRSEHDALMQMAFSLRDAFRARDPGAPAAALEFLRAWAQHHLGDTDQAYAAFLEAKGVR